MAKFTFFDLTTENIMVNKLIIDSIIESLNFMLLKVADPYVAFGEWSTSEIKCETSIVSLFEFK